MLATWRVRSMCLLFGLLVMATPTRAQSDEAGLERERRLIETYRHMLAEDPAQEYAFRRLLETAHAVGGVVGLVRLYRDQVDKDPRDYAAWLVLGNLQRTAGDVEAARVAFDKAAALAPERADPHLLLAALHRDERAFPEAFAAFERAIAKLRDRSARQDALRAAAETAVEAKDTARAEAWFDQLAATEPHNLFLRMQAASALTKLAEPALALAKWQEIEARAQGQLQHLVVIWKEIAELQSLLGRHDEAEATWRKGLERLPASHYERATFIAGLVGVYRRQDRLHALIEELTPKAERDAELLLVLARLHEELADDARALEYYRAAQKRRPADEEPRMAALRILERIGRTEEVIAAWLDLVRAFPREPRHQLELAELYFQHGKPKDAGDLMRKTSRAHPADPGVHAQLVDLWLRYGDKAARAEVENEYKILQRLEPDEPSHVVSLGEYYWASDDKTRALATWRRVLKLGKRPGEGPFMLGEILAEHELHEQALTEFRAAIAQDPDNPRFARAIALLYERLGKTGDALTEWNKILERGAGQRATPMVREARERVIQIWDKSRRLEREIAQLGARFSAEPPDQSAGRFLAVALLRLGRLDEARTTLERLDALAEGDLETLAGLEQVYTRLGESKRAIAVLERLAVAQPRAAVEYLHRAADLALGLGDEATALEAARKVIELAPADGSAHARVGDLYLRMGQRSEAAEAWRQTLALDPRNVPVRFKLASLYRDLGALAREEQVLAEILREAADTADVLRAGRRMLQLALTTGRLAELEALLRPLVEPGRRGRGRAAQLRLVVDLYGHMAQTIRFSASPPEARDKELAELGERALRPLLEALDDNDVATRTRAIEALELTHPPGAAPALARLAEEPGAMAQVEALAALGRTGTAGAVAALTRLGTSNQAQVRELTLWALGLSSSADAVPSLAERARRGSPRDRVIAAAALGHGRHPEALTLLRELARDRSIDVREAALWALGRSRRPEAVTDLAAALTRQGAPREATLAAWGLGQIATPEARDALVAALWSGVDGAADDAIWTALVHRREATSREASIEAIYQGLAARDRGLVHPVRPALYLPEPPTEPPSRDLLAALIGTTGAEGPLVVRMRHVLEQPESSARLALAGALTQLLASASAGADEVWTATLRALALLERPLLSAARDELDPVVRDATLALLATWWRSGGRGDAAELSELAVAALTATGAPEAPMRGALELLAALPPSGAPQTWTAALADRLEVAAPETRAAIARALTSLGDGAPAALIGGLLHDPALIVRVAVTRGIAAHNLQLPDGLVSDLFDLVRDPQPDLSAAAVLAIAAQGRPELLRRLQSDPTPHVRRALREVTGAP